MPCGGGVYWFCVSLFFVLVCYVILRHDVLFRVVLRCCDERRDSYCIELYRLCSCMPFCLLCVYAQFVCITYVYRLTNDVLRKSLR